MKLFIIFVIIFLFVGRFQSQIHDNDTNESSDSKSPAGSHFENEESLHDTNSSSGQPEHTNQSLISISTRFTPLKRSWTTVENFAIKMSQNFSATYRWLQKSVFHGKFLKSAKIFFAFAVSNTPKFLNATAKFVDFATLITFQRSLEVFEFGQKFIKLIGNYGMLGLDTMFVITEQIMRSNLTKSMLKSAVFHVQNAAIISHQASTLLLNRALWTYAEQSNLVSPLVEKIFNEGHTLSIFADTNNIYTSVPIFTKDHDYLGTFAMSDEEGSLACAQACWDHSEKARVGCGTEPSVGLSPECKHCQSFVWYSPRHAGGRLAGRCFAVWSPAWSPAVDLHVFAGRFLPTPSPPSSNLTSHSSAQHSTPMDPTRHDKMSGQAGEETVRSPATGLDATSSGADGGGEAAVRSGEDADVGDGNR